MKIHFLIINLLPLICISQNQLFIGSESTITANSQIILSDIDLTNNGTFNGNLKMTGTNINVADTFITNNSSMNIDVLNIEGNNAVNLENGDITISNAINLNSDDAALLLGSANIILEPTAQINNESNNRLISGAPNTYISISKTHSTASPEAFGNIGFEIINTASSLGSTSVFRNYGILDINGTETVRRYYTIQPANNSGLDVDAHFYFTDADLNGLEKSAITLFKSPDGLTNWGEAGGTLNDGSYPFINLSAINEFSVWAFTESGILSNNKTNLKSLLLYPNPVKQKLIVKAPNNTIINKIILTDILGKNRELNIVNNEINVANLENGFYYITLFTSLGKSIKKIIVNH